MLQRVDELTEPAVVGRYYSVPTIHYWWFLSEEKTWHLPVIGPRHNDAEIIKFHDWHYHVDARFVNSRTWKAIGEWYPNRGPEYAVAARPACHLDHPMHPPIVYRRLKCKRQVPYQTVYTVPWIAELEQKFSNCVLSGVRRICPHRGAPLAGIEPDAEGIITCPLHGLRWHLTTGRAAPRAVNQH